eukprot:scaffold371766_cov17-Prasinocladus_malaysianus.AAC.1
MLRMKGDKNDMEYADMIMLRVIPATSRRPANDAAVIFIVAYFPTDSTLCSLAITDHQSEPRPT